MAGVTGIHLTPGTYRNHTNDYYVMGPGVTQPYSSLDQTEKAEVRAHRKSAQAHAIQQFEARVPVFDGQPINEQVPGLSALQTLHEAHKAYDYTRSVYPWELNYYGDRFLADDAFRSRLLTPGQSVSTPASKWFEDSRNKNNFLQLLDAFKRRFVPSNLEASLYRALDLIQARDFITHTSSDQIHPK